MVNQEQEIKDLKEKINRLEAEKKQLESEITRLKKNWKELLDKKTNQISELNNLLIDKEGEIVRMRLEDDDKKRKLEGKITDLKEKIKEKELYLDQNAENMLLWINCHKGAKDESKKFEDQFIDADEANKKFQKNIENLQNQKQQLESKISQLLSEKGQTQNTNENVTEKDYQKERIIVIIIIVLFFSLGLNIYFILRNKYKIINNNKPYDKRKRN